MTSRLGRRSPAEGGLGRRSLGEGGWPTRAQTVAALVVFVALAVFHTWPLASGLNYYSRHDNADAMLNEWAIAWVAHQLPRNPIGLFHANIFYPEPHTLAFSEHLFVQGVMGAPLFWLGAPSLLVHNVLTIAGFALTGWAMCVVMYRWTGDWWAASLAGMLYAFNAHSLARFAHLQAMHVEFLPFAMLALDRLLTLPRLRYAIGLAAGYCLQSLTSNYQLAFTTFGVVGAALARPEDWLLWSRRRTFVLLLLAAAIALLVLAPFLVPYLQAQRDQGLTRTLGDAAYYRASWQDYLTTGSRLHYSWWSARFWRDTGAPLFPGFLAMTLAVAGAIRGNRPITRMWIGLGVVGVALSLGPSLPGYHLLYRAFPLLQGIRATVRFGWLFLAAVAVLAGFGFGELRRRWPATRARLAVSVAVLVIVTAEASRMPLGFSPRGPYRSPAIYRLLHDEAAAVIVELPLYAPAVWQLNAPYMLNSTRHWKPMLNGYSGFKPASYDRHYGQLRSFPDGASIDALRSIGVTHVVVTQPAFVREAGHETFNRIGETPSLRLMARSGDVSIYRLESPR